VASSYHKHSVQKGQRLRLVLLMQRENILYMTNSASIALFLADFYALSIRLHRWNTLLGYIPAYSF
jgi:hypothetical protein